jgi:CRISPR-associated protein Cmr2
MDSTTGLWQAKLAAWLHDPAEKALILMRTPAGHEAGTVARLRELCFGSDSLAPELDRVCRLADQWAAAADRPQWPRPKDGKYLGSDILFWDRDNARLVHPLAGDVYELYDLYLERTGKIEALSFGHFRELLADVEVARHEDGAPRLREALRSAFLTLWRLGPEKSPPGLRVGPLWRLLPADTRVPDHSIWEHLSLASAFAGAVKGDPEGNPALLLVSLGPVQGFIEQARSVSDLWAGSHLLSMMSWQAMKVVAEACGPDAVIFPSLWGVPLVDLWLEHEMNVTLPDDLEWKWRRSDANPLFAACLPNRFVALVPAAEAQGLGTTIRDAVRGWLREQAWNAGEKLLEAAAVAGDGKALSGQIESQLQEFPEVFWAAVPFAPLIGWNRAAGRYSNVEGVDGLKEALAAFCGSETGSDPGFLNHPLWRLLAKFVGSDGKQLELRTKDAGAPLFFTPNPGALYPALSDLLERVHAAAKSVRPVAQTRQEGYRCDLCGEWEWLRGPADGGRHLRPAGTRGETLWTRAAAKKPSWARTGEHLCARCALKRLWPTLFVDWLKATVKELEQEGLSRFVVSTHTMALAPDLAQLARPTRQERENEESFRRREQAWERLRDCARLAEHAVPLPKKLADMLEDGDDERRTIARRLPARLDELAERARAAEGEAGEKARHERETIESSLKVLLGHRPEAYYGLILMDGDGMGRWMSGDDRVMLRYRDSWHPALAKDLSNRFTNWAEVHEYFEARRAASPSHHAAVSSALNNFSLHVARWVVEELFLGRVIYAGGDDVLAMVAVDDLLPCMLVLRCAYAGIVPAGEKGTIWALYKAVKDRLTRIDRGYVLLGEDGKEEKRLLRMMGGRATASAGAVVAHHTAPLQAVLRRLRRAERAAKEHGRNAFSIALMKRAGGETAYTASWGFGGIGDAQQAGATREASEPRDIPYEPARWAASTAELRTPMGVLFELRDTLAAKGVSRRAAYNVLSWLSGVPAAPGDQLDETELSSLLTRSIAFQLARQGMPPDVAGSLAAPMVAVAIRQCRPAAGGKPWASVAGHIESMLTVAEFLAREGRTLSGRTPAAPPAGAVQGGDA